MHYSSPANNGEAGEKTSSDSTSLREQEGSQHCENKASSSPGCPTNGQGSGEGPLGPSAAHLRAGLGRWLRASGEGGESESSQAPCSGSGVHWGRG